MSTSGGPVVTSGGMAQSTIALLFTGALHLAGLAALVVLIALGNITWSDAGPIIGYLLGVGTATGTIAVSTASPASSTPKS